LITEKEIWQALQDVKDPEIPTISLVDLGVVTGVHFDGENVRVTMTPTFVGCPAMDYMKREVEERLRQMPLKNVTVEINLDEPWSTNRITEAGRAALKKHGLAEPPKFTIEFELDVLEHLACPYCGSSNTQMKSPFGPTLCRTLHYCNNCRQAFEGFKPL